MPHFTLSGTGAVEDDVTGGPEDNNFMLLGGTVGGNVDSGGGADEVTIDDAAVAGLCGRWRGRGYNHAWERHVALL